MDWKNKYNLTLEAKGGGTCFLRQCKKNKDICPS